MPPRKWFVIAKNEYRTLTSSVRKFRTFFLPLVAGLLAVYVILIAPVVVSFFVDDFLALIVSVAAVPLVQIMLFVLFFYLILFPISDTLREIKTDQIELFLAAPVKPGEVLLGEFLGRMPFYAIAIAVIVGTLTALIRPIGLDIFQNVTIIIVFIVTLLSAMWIGTVIAAVLRAKLGKTARGKDIGKGLGVVVALPGIAVIYAIIGGGLITALLNSTTSETVRTALSLLPSSWAAEIFVGFASNPSNIGAVWFETMIRFGGLLLFFAAVLWAGMKAASRAYSLEAITFTAPKARPDGRFYRTVRSLGGGGSSGTLLATIFKDYGRRFENVSWIVYAVGLVAMVTIFLSDPFKDPGGPLIMLSILAIPLLAALTVGTVSRGKETLFIYKKSPHGIGRFVKARLVQAWLVTVPIGAAFTALMTMTAPQLTWFSLSANVLSASLRTMVIVALLLGLALLIPVFAEGSRERTFGAMINFQVILFATIALELGFPRAGLSFRRLFPNLDPFIGALYNHLLQTVIFFLIAALLVYLGQRKLSKIE